MPARTISRRRSRTSARALTGLNETVASGPYFKVQLTNLLPYWILQPWVDAAFKKRGIDPEDFWRSAGLPAFRFPDPNGTRFPNGAPPPAPTDVGRHPGSSVSGGGAGVARARTRRRRSCCRGRATRCRVPVSTRTWGRSGPNGPYPALPDVASSPPNPAGLPPTPGIPIAGRPGAGPTGRARHTGADRTRTARGSHRAAGTATGPGSGESRCGATTGTGGPRTPGPAGAGRQLPAPYIANTGGAGGSGAQGGNQN